MTEREYDQLLQIKTVGLREWSNKESAIYNRYEATPYEALETLVEQYNVPEESQLVDFGSGRGRVAFFLHNHYQIPVTGVEAHDKTFDEALKNKATYRKKRAHIKEPISFQFALAEQYEVDTADTLFYFFNPFSVRIFKRVVQNILKSYEQNKRTMELILYYPLPEFKEFLQQHTPFEMINKIKVKGVHGKYGKFAIYRMT